MYTRKYNSDCLVEQFWLEANTTNEFTLSFPTSGYFSLPDIGFLQHMQSPFFVHRAMYSPFSAGDICNK